jgi:hypothetical protein
MEIIINSPGAVNNDESKAVTIVGHTQTWTLEQWAKETGYILTSKDAHAHDRQQVPQQRS